MLNRQFTPSLLEWGGKRRKKREGLWPSKTTRNVLDNNEIPEIKEIIGSGNGNGNRSRRWQLGDLVTEPQVAVSH